MQALRLTVVGLVLVAASLPSSLPAGTINVLIVADTNDKRIGDGTAIDLMNLQRVFRSNVPRKQLRLKTLSGRRVSKREILKTLRTFHAKGSDAMVFFWSGHGAYDKQGHFFRMPNGTRLYRSEVVKAVKARGAGLDAVISCSCNVFVRLAASPSNAAPAPLMGKPLKPRHVAPVFQKLFLESRGLVDINSSSEGEFGFGDSIDGSTFFDPLCSYLNVNAERKVDWRTLIREMRPRVHLAFRSLYPRGYSRGLKNAKTFVQITQSLRVWHQPPGWPGLTANGIGGQRFRFGVVGRNHRDGIYITSVYRGYPGSHVTNRRTGRRATLERGDIILSINGRRMRNTRDFWNAVKRSARTMDFVVRCVRCRRKHRMRARLRDGS